MSTKEEAKEKAIWLQKCRSGALRLTSVHGGYFRREEAIVLRKRDAMYR